MRILIAPNFQNSYDQRMVNGLARGFTELEHEGIPLAAPLPPDVLISLAERVGANVVMQVNRFRPYDPPLPSHIRHISWFQDVFPDTAYGAYEGAREGDIVYALGDAGVLGLKIELPCYVGSLVTGVDPSILKTQIRRVGKQIDFSLCGFIPAPMGFVPNIKADLVWYMNDLVDRIPILGSSWSLRQARARLLKSYMPYGYVPYALANALRATTEALYQPLTGSLDITALSTAMYDEAGAFARPKSNVSRRHWTRRGKLGRILAPYRTASRDRNSALDNFINYMAREYPRLLDRELFLQRTLEVSKSVELYGPGWETHEQFRPYHKGTVTDLYPLLDIFRRSRINLANNTHGFGLHSRTLECMAIGGLIFTHTSPHDDKPGGMLTSFEPDVHYGVFTPETFGEQARRWLKDEKARVKVGERAACVIREKHLWRHRAQQILDDLKR